MVELRLKEQADFVATSALEAAAASHFAYSIINHFVTDFKKLIT